MPGVLIIETASGPAHAVSLFTRCSMHAPGWGPYLGPLCHPLPLYRRSHPCVLVLWPVLTYSCVTLRDFPTLCFLPGCPSLSSPPPAPLLLPLPSRTLQGAIEALSRFSFATQPSALAAMVPRPGFELQEAGGQGAARPGQRGVAPGQDPFALQVWAEKRVRSCCAHRQGAQGRVHALGGDQTSGVCPDRVGLPPFTLALLPDSLPGCRVWRPRPPPTPLEVSEAAAPGMHSGTSVALPCVKIYLGSSALRAAYLRTCTWLRMLPAVESGFSGVVQRNGVHMPPCATPHRTPGRPHKPCFGIDLTDSRNPSCPTSLPIFYSSSAASPPRRRHLWARGRQGRSQARRSSSRGRPAVRHRPLCTAQGQRQGQEGRGLAVVRWGGQGQEEGRQGQGGGWVATVVAALSEQQQYRPGESAIRLSLAMSIWV